MQGGGNQSKSRSKVRHGFKIQDCEAGYEGTAFEGSQVDMVIYSTHPTFSRKGRCPSSVLAHGAWIFPVCQNGYDQQKKKLTQNMQHLLDDFFGPLRSLFHFSKARKVLVSFGGLCSYCTASNNVHASPPRCHEMQLNRSHVTAKCSSRSPNALGIIPFTPAHAKSII